MNLASSSAVLAFLALSDAYTFGGGYGCGSPRNAVFQAKLRDMTAQQQAEYLRKQAEFVDRAFESLTNDIKKSSMDKRFIPKQNGLVDKAVEFLSEMGCINRNDAESLIDFTNKGFEIAQDVVAGAYSPAYEVQNKDSEVEISLDLPGVAKNDIEIVCEGELLKVSGSRNVGRGEVTNSVPFTRVFPMEQEFDTDKIAASLDHGVLTIRIPMKEPEELPVKRINIQ